MIKNKNSWWVSGLAIAASFVGTAPLAHADTAYDFSIAKAQAGAQISFGQCPCVRWQIQTKAISGQYENKDIFISIDALFQFTQANSTGFKQLASRLYTAGKQVEVYSKEGHVGVGFNGFQWGSDPDRGLSEVLRTGFYFIVGLLQTDPENFKQDGLSIDLHEGYNYDEFTNLLGAKGVRGLFDSAVALHFKDGPFTMAATGHIGIDASHPIDMKRVVVGADVTARERLGKLFDEFEIGISGQVSAEYDGFRETLGLNPTNIVTSVLLDMSYVDRNRNRH